MSQATIGTIYLNVANLEKMLTFYQEVIGLQIHHQDNKRAHLGVGAEDLLVLTETPDHKWLRGITGLFHFAILVPSRLQLAKSLRRIAETKTALQGLSEHHVSEAIYLADPEGNGIEIYRDRPREDWYVDGEFRLITERMDVDGVMSTLNDRNYHWEGLPSGTIMGHIHLHVASVAGSERFYRDVLGMDVMINAGSATFMSYDGYHHHLGANIWGGRNLPTEKSLGLDQYELYIQDSTRLETILSNLDKHNIIVDEKDSAYHIQDPSLNHIILKSP